MKNCIFHFLPAKAGDCFVLEFSNKDCIIIDCGFSSTYQNELKPLLLQLKSKGCKVILLLIIHPDKDHIKGAIELRQHRTISGYRLCRTSACRFSVISHKNLLTYARSLNTEPCKWQ